MKYSSLFLDLDNTLLDFDIAEAVAVRKVLAKHSLPCDDEAVKVYSQINLSFWKRFEMGEIPKNAIFEGRFCAFLEHYGCTGDVSAISKDYCQNLAEGYFTVNGAIEILAYLKNKGYKLYATTNGFSFTQYNRIKHSGLEPFFDNVFISEDAGHQKPEKEYFDYVLSHIPEKDKSRILVVGDSQSSDILGGINSGLDTCWFNPKNDTPKYKNNYEIASLLELKNIL